MNALKLNIWITESSDDRGNTVTRVNARSHACNGLLCFFLSIKHTTITHCTGLSCDT